MSPTEDFKVINIKDDLRLLWRKKWLIIIPTLILTTIAAIMTFFEKPIWELEAVFQPGFQLRQNRRGEYEESPIVEPKQIAVKIIRKSFNGSVASSLKIAERVLPRFGAENPKGTRHVRIWSRSRDSEIAMRSLHALLGSVMNELDRMLEDANISLKNQIAKKKKSIAEYDLDVKTKSNAIGLLEAQIKSILAQITNDENGIRISEDRSQKLAEIVDSAFKRNTEMENRIKTARERKRGDLDDRSLTLFSSEIRENLKIIISFEEINKDEENIRDSLRQDITRNEDVRRSLDQKISETKTDIEKIRRLSLGLREQIDAFNQQLSRSEPCQLIQEPFQKKDPVRPDKKKIIGLALILGLILSGSLVVFLDYLENDKKRTR